jgi:eukaryotic-like serine/threonine-protein kinase
MPQVVAAPVREGDILAAKYRVDKILGAGGMGVVVAATHLKLDQRVALKFLINNDVDDQAAARFLREARAVVKLRSENVVRVLDTGTLDHGQPYIVMELLEGRDLAQELSLRGRVTVVEAADWVLQACEGIAEAHSVGIVHRDLKPANLFLTRRADHSTLIKVLDFGIAKLLDVQRAPDYSLTKTATLMGSPHYMSPEQIRNAKSVDQRADIWALGIVLYELVAGRAPFSATTAPALLAQIVADPPQPLRAARPEVPRALEALINRCLEKDPARRFANVADLARELARFASEEGRASSERVSRISLPPAVRKPAQSEALLQLATGPTLIAIEPHARARRRVSAVRWAVPLALGLSGACGVLWFALRERGASPVPARSVSVPAPVTWTPAAVAPAPPLVTPVSGSVSALTAPVAATATAVAAAGQGALAAPAASALSSSVFHRANLRVPIRVDPTRPASGVSLDALSVAPLVRAPDPPPAENPLDERK